MSDGPPATALRPITNGTLQRRLRGTDVCTVIFSSGTSGQIKALLLSRAGVDATIDALAKDWELGDDDGILVALPLSIFQQRLMIYAALRKGTQILLTDPANLFRSFKVLRPTVVLGPPALVETAESRFLALPPRRRRVLLALSRGLRIVPAARLRARLRRRLFRDTSEAFGGRIRVLLTGSAPAKRSTLEFYELAGLPLFQAYGLAEVGFIAWNRPGRNRLGSVGRPLIPASVSIAEDEEILVSTPHPQALGYFGLNRAEAELTFLPDGRIATGDLGRLDRDGYLYITGRKKSVILLQSGEKINPEPLELELSRTADVERAVVLGGGELRGLAAVVAIAADCSAEREAALRAELRVVIDDLNSRVKPASRIVRWIVTRAAFRPETGLLTRNLKIDRRAVHRHFEAELLRAAPEHSQGRPS
jgi:long-subunit acyl-CoA synthetase (AMP-forming)